MNRGTTGRVTLQSATGGKRVGGLSLSTLTLNNGSNLSIGGVSLPSALVGESKVWAIDRFNGRGITTDEHSRKALPSTERFNSDAITKMSADLNIDKAGATDHARKSIVDMWCLTASAMQLWGGRTVLTLSDLKQALIALDNESRLGALFYILFYCTTTLYPVMHPNRSHRMDVEADYLKLRGVRWEDSWNGGGVHNSTTCVQHLYTTVYNGLRNRLLAVVQRGDDLVLTIKNKGRHALEAKGHRKKTWYYGKSQISEELQRVRTQGGKRECMFTIVINTASGVYQSLICQSHSGNPLKHGMQRCSVCTKNVPFLRTRD
jgi:hypothetical protein